MSVLKIDCRTVFHRMCVDKTREWVQMGLPLPLLPFQSVLFPWTRTTLRSPHRVILVSPSFSEVRDNERVGRMKRGQRSLPRMNGNGGETTWDEARNDVNVISKRYGREMNDRRTIVFRCMNRWREGEEEEGELSRQKRLFPVDMFERWIEDTIGLSGYQGSEEGRRREGGCSE